MTQRDGSKARASAICIVAEHLVWTVVALPEKMAGQCLFRLQNPVTSRCWLGQGHDKEGRGKVMIEIVTAGILVIGDEILSGRTKDKNIGFTAEYLTNIG